MSSVFKPMWFAAVVLSAAMSVPAQPERRSRPAPKPAPAEAQDKSKQAAELFDAAQSAHQAGDLAKAVELYGKALTLDPELWQAEYQRGSAYFSLGKLAEAKTSMAHVTELLAQYPASDQVKQISARVQTTLGEIALAEAKPDEAEKAFRRALEINQSGAQSARAHSGLAEVLLAANKHADAIAEANAAIAAGETRAATYALLGVALTATRKFDEALPALNEALKRDPKNALALSYRAEVFIAKNKPIEAAADLRAALAVEPRTQTKLRLAALQAQAKQFNEAITLFQEVLKEDPSNADARVGLTGALIESGRAADAAAGLPEADQATVIAAAWLHDIGYAAPLRCSTFHPLDGAWYLREHAWPEQLAGLVAHHSAARFVAADRGLAGPMADFPAARFAAGAVADALTYADQTTGPDGQVMDVEVRMAEMLRRHGPDSPNARVHTQRGPVILAAVRRTEQRLRPQSSP